MPDKAKIMAAFSAALDAADDLEAEILGFKMARVANPDAPVPEKLRPYIEEAKPKTERRDRNDSGGDDDKPWNEGRLTGLAKRLYAEGKDDSEVAAALKRRNSDSMVVAQAQQRGKAEAGV